MYLDFTINQANNQALKRLDDVQGIALMGIMTDEYSTTSDNRAACVDIYAILSSLPQVKGGTQGVAGPQGVQGIMGVKGNQGPQGTKGKDATLDQASIDIIIDTVTKNIANSLDLYAIIPIGTILTYAGTVAPKSSRYEYAICNGAALNQYDYSDLYALLGNKFGAEGNNFNLPNLSGRSIKGLSANDSLGTIGGDNNQKLTKTDSPTGLLANNAYMELNYIIRIK